MATPLITLIGTSHISEESIKEIKSTLEGLQPDIVAVELDAQRAASLLSEEKRKISMGDAFHIGLRGYLFAKIGQYVQEKLGEKVGVSPGAEMKTALLWAKKNKKEVALIDQPIQITLKKFSQNLGWKEKFRFVGDFFLGIFAGKKQLKKWNISSIDLRKVPTQELIHEMMHQMKSRYPSLYKVLVEERNRYMVKQLVKLLREKQGKKIVAVIGAGHKKGMEELLKKV
ncbi:TraB/GumN family protein, partial [Candidatus Woesearchaeota archaeon]|nr:TraB/GumN family protein [Candidatus Woesearchaeota archaeon]